MQIWPGRTFGNRGLAPWPERLVKSDGIRTSVRKFLLCQSNPGLRPTRVADCFVSPFFALARTTLVRLFREKGVGTVGQPYKLTSVKQLFCDGRAAHGVSFCHPEPTERSEGPHHCKSRLVFLSRAGSDCALVRGLRGSG